jgi:hypothetical protein
MTTKEFGCNSGGNLRKEYKASDDSTGFLLGGFSTRVYDFNESSRSQALHQEYERQRQENERAAERRREDARREQERSQREAEARQASEREARLQDQLRREAELRRQSVPMDMQPRHDTRMPVYETQESLSRKGYNKDTISTINSKSTPISYFEANSRNEEGRAKYGENYTTEYKPDSYITKAEVNPNGSDNLSHVHNVKSVPNSSDWLTSSDGMRASYDGNQNPQEFIKKRLDLPPDSDASFISEARLKSGGGYNVEISRTFSGTEQINAPREKTDYSRTSPIGNLFRWLRG